MPRAGDTELREVEITYETVDGVKCEYEYEARSSGRETGEIKTKSADGQKDKRTDESALAEVKRLVEGMSLHPGQDREEILESACRVLALDQARLRYLAVEVEFSDGREIEAKLH